MPRVQKLSTSKGASMRTIAVLFLMFVLLALRPQNAVAQPSYDLRSRMGELKSESEPQGRFDMTSS